MADPFAPYDQHDDRVALLAEEAPGDNAPALSVSELSGALKRTVEDRFGHVRVRGEISGWKRHVSGHCYLTLKDDKACMDGVVWKGQASAMRFRPAAEARAMRRPFFWPVLAAGLIIAGFVAIPLLNLFTPLFATALMVRLHKRLS